MKYLRQTDPRFQYLGSKVGLFLFLLGFSLLAMTALLAWQQDFFRKMVALETAPEQGQNITAGMEVTLHGIRVGRVTSVGLDDQGLPIVHLSMRQDAYRWLTDEASIRLSGLDPLAKPYLNLQPGTGQGQWPAKQRLPFERDLTLGETTAELERQLRPVITEAAALVTALNSEKGEVRRTLKNLADLSEEVARRIPAVLANAEGALGSTNSLVSRLASEEGELFTTLRSASGMSADVEERLPILIQEMEASLASLRRTTAEIESTMKSASPEVREIIATSRETAEKADRFLVDLREIWLFKLFFPRRNQNQE
jgi:phospholipid/cholesterol/gamma-HCH transport system substrate-binding protein